MPQAHEEVGRFIQKHRPDVVIYDVGMPYAGSWDLLEVIRTSPALQRQPFVITTGRGRHVRHQDRRARYRSASILKAVEAAAAECGAGLVGVVRIDLRQ